jgi:HEAT repeat protein
LAHVFISYAHVDVDFANRLKREIENADFTVWIDTERLRAGEDWRTEIDNAIRDSMALILIMSRASLNSKYVAYEWAFALGIGVKVVPVLIAQVGFGEVHPRLEVLQYLDFTHYGAGLWERLIQRLREVEDQHRPNTVRVSRDAPPAVQQAVMALDSHTPDERKAAIESLAQMNHPTAHEALVAAMQHPLREVHIDATMRLIAARYRNKQAIPSLIEATEPQNSSSVRQQAVTALGEIGGEEAILHLIQLLDEQDARVHEAVLNALVTIGVAAAPVLASTLLHTTDSKVRQAAAATLQSIGTPALPGLLEALDEGGESSVAEVAATRLIKQMGAAAIPALEKQLITYTDRSSNKAARILGEMGDSGLRTLIRARLSDNPAVRNAAQSGLTYNYNVFVGLIQFLTHISESKLDEDIMARKVATRILLDGNYQTINAMMKVLDTKDFAVLNTVALLLKRIEDKPSTVAVWVKILNQLPISFYRMDKLQKQIYHFALNYLVTLGDAAVTELVSVLNNRSRWFNAYGDGKLKSETRALAAEILGQIGSRAAFQGLVEALNERDLTVAWKVEAALRKIGTPDALEILARRRRIR